MAPTHGNGLSHMPVPMNYDLSKKQITLNNGRTMPIMGLGLFRMEGKEVKDLLFEAIRVGYRHFDCAGIST